MRYEWILEYVSRTLKHKWYVFVECCKLGIPIKGILHDLSKFSPKEFKGYCRYQGMGGFLTGINIDWNTKHDFEMAWNHHQKHNPHHWQYYVQYSEKGSTALQMPYNDMLEMVADWRAMSIEFNNKPEEWFEKNRHKMLLHPNTMDSVKEQLGVD